MEFEKKYLQNSYLMIENLFMIEKNDLKSIDDIIISHHSPGRNHGFSMFLNQPMMYEMKQDSFINHKPV